MKRTPAENRLARALATRTKTTSSDWFPVFKARYGMQVAFEAVRDEIGEGSVSTQLLTCCTAVAPILVAGLVPRYEEISAETASIDPMRWVPAAPIRALVIQHTYGLIDDESARVLVEGAHAAGIAVVEDSAHCAGRMARDAAGAPLADVSVHSFGIEKMLPSQFGGAVWVNPDSPFQALSAELARRLSALPVMGRRLDALCRAYLGELRVLSHLPGGMRRALWDALPRWGLFEPAVAASERAGGLGHAPMRPSAAVCDRALAAFEGLDELERTHAAAVEVYRRELDGAPGLTPVGAHLPAGQPLLRFPILAADTATADRVTRAVCEAGFYTTAWYRPELTPGVTDEAAYRVPPAGERGRLAVADDFIARVATLPADVTAEEASRIAAVVRDVVTS